MAADLLTLHLACMAWGKKNHRQGGHRPGTAMQRCGLCQHKARLIATKAAMQTTTRHANVARRNTPCARGWHVPAAAAGGAAWAHRHTHPLLVKPT